jgi:hypothetical protein
MGDEPIRFVALIFFSVAPRALGSIEVSNRPVGLTLRVNCTAEAGEIGNHMPARRPKDHAPVLRLSSRAKPLGPRSTNCISGLL